MQNSWFDQLLRRVQGEYLEMPGLRLTRFQAQRLWALDAQTCTTVLAVLVERGFLSLDADAYKRASDGTPAIEPRAAGSVGERRRDPRNAYRI